MLWLSINLRFLLHVGLVGYDSRALKVSGLNWMTKQKQESMAPLKHLIISVQFQSTGLSVVIVIVDSTFLNLSAKHQFIHVS